MRTLFSSVLQIEEGAPNGSPVIKVHAVDKDKGVNGQVRYSIVQQPNQKGTKFNVDEETGELFTNKVFDREGEDGKQVRAEKFGPILSFGQLAHSTFD